MATTATSAVTTATPARPTTTPSTGSNIPGPSGISGVSLGQVVPVATDPLSATAIRTPILAPVITVIFLLLKCLYVI
jgi:hypothetical protein